MEIKPSACNIKDTFIVSETPINSLFGRGHNTGYKCFTYFSDLKDYWNSIRSYTNIQIFIGNDFAQYPPVYLYAIAIHSPKIIPSYSLTHLIIKPYEQILVKYSQLNVELILDGFESNCAEYNIGNEYGTIRMESDCRVYCIAEYVKENFNSTFPWILDVNSEDLIRREVWSSIDSITIDFKRYLNKKVLDICSTKCKPDCNTKQYLSESKGYHQSKPWQQLACVILQHSSTPDIIVRHTLEMNLMSFVCNFGGY